MKKLLILIFVLLMVAFTLAACSGSSDEGADTPDTSEPVSVESLKTFGDVIALEKEDVQTSVGGGYVVYAFKYGDTYYRVKSAIPADLEDVSKSPSSEPPVYMPLAPEGLQLLLYDPAFDISVVHVRCLSVHKKTS